MAGTSVVQMFVAGIVPGLIDADSASWACATGTRVRYNWPVRGDLPVGASSGATVQARRSGRSRCPIIILGGIFGGIVTATEGAALAVIAALFVGLRRLSRARLEHLRAAIIEGGVQTGGGDAAGGRSSALLGTLPHRGAGAAGTRREACRTSPPNKWAVLAMLNVLFLLLGMFLHSAAAIILVVPDRDAAGDRGGHRSGPLRPDRDAQPRHRPADAAGGERADGHLLDREGERLGRDQGQHSLHRRAARSR